MDTDSPAVFGVAGQFDFDTTQILETLAEGFQALDPEWRYVYLNRRAEEILGRKREELLGKICWEEYPDAVGTPFHDRFLEAMRTGKPVVFEDLCPHTRNWVEFSLYAVPGGLVAYQRDSTERKRAEERAARLQSVTGALSESLTPAQVVDVVVAQVVDALEARAGLVALLTPDGAELEVVRDTGYAPETIARWHRFPVRARLPLSDVVRDNVPLFFEEKHSFYERYPEVAREMRSAEESAAALPLVAHGRVIGGMYLTFPRTRPFSAEDKGFLLTLARQCAQALERARLYEEALVARRRMAFLAEVSAVLAGSLDYESTLSSLADLMVPELADWCAVDVPGENNAIRRLAVAHRDPARVRWAHEVQRRYPPDPHASQGVAAVLRTGEPELYPEITDALLAALARDAEHLALLRQIGLSSIMLVPLAARGQILGALSFVTTAESDRHYGPEDLAFARDVAHRAAVAVDNVRLYRRAQEEIAERRWAQEASWRLASIVESSTDAIIGKTLEGIITSWNAGAERLYGYKASEVIGRNIALLIPPERADDLPWILQRIGRGEIVAPYETVRRRKDGTLLDVSLTVSPIRDEGRRVIGASAIARDITGRKQIEAEKARLLGQIQEAARQQRTFLRDVLASVTEGKLHLCDTAGDLPERLAPVGETIELTRATQRALQSRTMEVAQSLEFDKDRGNDLLIAVLEASMNAVVHAGYGTAWVGTDGSETIQVWIADQGKGIDMDQIPHLTLGRGQSGEHSPGFGHGFWLILRSIDRCFLLTGASGTTLVLEQNKTPPEPIWMARL